MIQTIRKAWGIPELRKKIIFTALILLIFRIGNAIPVPYVNTGLLGTYMDQLSTTVLSLYNVMSGGAFAQATVFALGVQPYINSSIIIQLLTIAIPSLGRMAQEGGEEGKKKIQSITRYATVAIALLQGFGYYSLSGILITGSKGAELGTVALLSNIIRELLTLLGAPLLARWFGSLAPIAAGGATTADTTLPVITRTCGDELAVVSIYHGMVVDFSVPFLVTFFCSLG